MTTTKCDDSEKEVLSSSEPNGSIHHSQPERAPKTTTLDLPLVHQPPDGGARAWSVMMASFLCNGIIFGIINCFGVLYGSLYEEFVKKGVRDASARTSLIGSAAIGTTFFLSPVAAILTDRFGIQKISTLGAGLAVLGMIISAFLYQHPEALVLSYGVIFGSGCSLAYTPSLVILGHYFKKRMGLVNGIVTMGSSLFTISMQYLLQFIIDFLGLKHTFLILSAIVSVLFLCSYIFKPTLPLQNHHHRARRHKEKGTLKGAITWFWALFINFEIWKNKKYVIWTLAIPLSLFGYFVTYVHLIEFVKCTLPDYDGKDLILCIGITSGVGRLLFGKVADIKRVNRIVLQQISFYCLGILTLLIAAANSFTFLIIICLAIGLFDGCFISLLGPVAFDICGPHGASQAIGFLLGLCSLPLTIGPPIAGLIFDSSGSYIQAFVSAGIPPILGATAMFLIYYVKAPQPVLSPTDTVTTLIQPSTNGVDASEPFTNGDIKPVPSEVSFHTVPSATSLDQCLLISVKEFDSKV